MQQLFFDALCEQCLSPLEIGRNRFCSKKCDEKWRYCYLTSHRKSCSRCGREYRADKRSKESVCRSCRSSEMNGEKHPNWKGGHIYWKEGRFGRDKDGLSWKVQRQLCRERDNHTCQDCGKTKEELGREPDCDHVIPYRISGSHALENLILRCSRCHHRVEAQRKELWQGSVFGVNIGNKQARPRGRGL